MEFSDAPGQKAERVPRGIATLADAVPGAQVKNSRRRGGKRRNAVAPPVGKSVDNDPSASQKTKEETCAVMKLLATE